MINSTSKVEFLLTLMLIFQMINSTPNVEYLLRILLENRFTIFIAKIELPQDAQLFFLFMLIVSSYIGKHSKRIFTICLKHFFGKFEKVVCMTFFKKCSKFSFTVTPCWNLHANLPKNLGEFSYIIIALK